MKTLNVNLYIGYAPNETDSTHFINRVERPCFYIYFRIVNNP